MAKLEKMTRFLPGLYKPTVNPTVRGLLYSWSGADDQLVQAIQDAKDQLFVLTAKLQYLDALGSNVGVFRPAAVNLADDQFRALIPALSFSPKQVRPTIQKVLDVFYGVGNPSVTISEVNANEVVIQIPSSVPSLRRNLKGALHFHNYSGTITAIDNIGKTITMNLDGAGIKNLVIDELAGGLIGQNGVAEPILSNTAGHSGVILQFVASADLSGFATGHVRLTNPRYPGAYLPNKTKAFTVTAQRGTLGQSITQGGIYPTLFMNDASEIPDASGLLVFNYGFGNQEEQVKYFGRPNNHTLLLDPAYNFQKSHSIGELVNVIVKPYRQPRVNGSDYSIYLVGVTAARILAQQIVESVLAAGIVVRWIIVEPEC